MTTVMPLLLIRECHISVCVYLVEVFLILFLIFCSTGRYTLILLIPISVFFFVSERNGMKLSASLSGFNNIIEFKSGYYSYGKISNIIIVVINIMICNCYNIISMFVISFKKILGSKITVRTCSMTMKSTLQHFLSILKSRLTIKHIIYLLVYQLKKSDWSMRVFRFYQ